MKQILLAAGIALACVTAAHAGVIEQAQRKQAQTWSAWGGEIGVRWNRDLLANLGVTLEAPSGRIAREDRRRHEWFQLRQTGGLEFSVRNATLQRFEGGSLQMRGGYVLRLADGSRIDLRDLSMRVRASDPNILDVVSGDGKVWFYTDRVMFELADGNRTLAVRAADLRITPELAARIGVPEVASWELADLSLNTEVNVQGSGGQPDGVCSPYPWPGVAVPGVPGATYQADLFMKALNYQQAGCQSCDGPGGTDGIVSFVPSSTLRNNVNDGATQTTISGDPLGTSGALYTANVAWRQMFTGNNPPYNNDQHPYLIWNMYRINADGSIEQIGRSGVKHAFLTTNGGCADSCNDSHSLGRSCSDTYGTGNNDSPGDLGPRSEIIPATGQWGRCGSIWDRTCTGTEHNNGNDNWTQRLKTRESQVDPAANPGATYVMDSWYLAREDINIYNSMATVTGIPRYTSGLWTLSNQGAMQLGAAIDRWVDPGNPGANAKNTELATAEGHAKVAVKVTDLGGGNWRYHYAVMNFDFSRAVTEGSEPNLRVLSNKGFDSFTVPVPGTATVSTKTFRDGDLDATNDWVALGGNRASWSTSGRTMSNPGGAQTKPTLDWGTLYSFSVVVNRAPVAGQATLHVAQAGTPASYQVATLVPGN
ncbi:hypothetical protein [Dokdonella sp.]|uniref:hypothetical protein n=1 Tax=Dokdonella sp. TaxID=2291710 RepID=UPI001AFD2F9A|nr:hypothetical protein [Dokdonella sp.]MBO9662914.1 hypothetical protein [Dokdonella sp.]